MRFLSYLSGVCLFVGLTLVLFVGGLVVYETCAGRPLFDYGLLPGADKEPVLAPTPAKKGGKKDGAPAARGNAPAAGAPKKADKAAGGAAALSEMAVPHFTVTSAWELRGDVRVTLRPRLRGLAPRSFPAYLAGQPVCAPAGGDPYVLECQGQEWRREQAFELLGPQAEASLGDVQWLALGACPELPALKGRLRLFYPAEPLEIAWESARAGNNRTLTRGEMRFTLRNRQLHEGRYHFAIEFSLPETQFPGECFIKSARAFLRSHGKPCPVLTPLHGNCRRHNGRLEGNVDFALDAPLLDAEVVFRGFSRMAEETLEFAQPSLALPPLPGGRRLGAPAHEEPPAACTVEGQRLAAVGMSLNRECFTDGRADGKTRCVLNLRWELGQRSDVVACQGEGKARVSGGEAAGEARVRGSGQGRERDGRRIFFQVEWEEEPVARPEEDGARGFAGELPPVRVATAWKTAEFAIERGADGRPAFPREQGGMKLVRANENPNRWCNYTFEVGPETIPEDVFPLAAAVCEATLEPAPARPPWVNVHRQGQKTIVNLNVHRHDEAIRKITLRWPAAAKEITPRFALTDVPLPERRAPMRKELF